MLLLQPISIYFLFCFYTLGKWYSKGSYQWHYIEKWQWYGKSCYKDKWSTAWVTPHVCHDSQPTKIVRSLVLLLKKNWHRVLLGFKMNKAFGAEVNFLLFWCGWSDVLYLVFVIGSLWIWNHRRNWRRGGGTAHSFQMLAPYLKMQQIFGKKKMENATEFFVKTFSWSSYNFHKIVGAFALPPPFHALTSSYATGWNSVEAADCNCRALY